MSRVDEIRERLSKVSGWPRGWWTEEGAPGCVYAHVPGGRPNGEGLLEVRYYSGPQRPNAPADAEFIAHAPEDIAFLLSQLEATEKRYQALVEVTKGILHPARGDASWLHTAEFDDLRAVVAALEEKE